MGVAQVLVLATLALVLGINGSRELCEWPPKYQINGEDVMLSHNGNVTVMAFFRPSSPESPLYIHQFHLVQQTLPPKYSDIIFAAVNWNDPLSSLLHDHLNKAISNAIVYQDNDFDNATAKLGAKENDVFIYDRCGRLTYNLSISQNADMVACLFAGIMSTYVNNPCGTCSDDDESSEINELDDEFQLENISNNSTTFSNEELEIAYNNATEVEDNLNSNNSKTVFEIEPELQLKNIFDLKKDEEEGNSNERIILENISIEEINLQDHIEKDDVAKKKEVEPQSQANNATLAYSEDAGVKSINSENGNIHKYLEDFLNDSKHFNEELPRIQQNDLINTKQQMSAKMYNFTISLANVENDTEMVNSNKMDTPSKNTEQVDSNMYNLTIALTNVENDTEIIKCNQTTNTQELETSGANNTDYAETLIATLESWFFPQKSSEDPGAVAEKLRPMWLHNTSVHGQNKTEVTTMTSVNVNRRKGIGQRRKFKEKHERSDPYVLDEACFTLNMNGCSGYSKAQKTLTKECCQLRASNNRLLSISTLSKCYRFPAEKCRKFELKEKCCKDFNRILEKIEQTYQKQLKGSMYYGCEGFDGFLCENLQKYGVANVPCCNSVQRYKSRPLKGSVNI